MAPSGMNPWLRRYARTTGTGPSRPYAPNHAASGDVLGDIDELAATYWGEWTPAKSAAEEFKTKLGAYIRTYYRRRPPV